MSAPLSSLPLPDLDALNVRLTERAATAAEPERADIAPTLRAIDREYDRRERFAGR